MPKQTCHKCFHTYPARLTLCPFCVAVEDALIPAKPVQKPKYDETFQAPIQSRFAPATPQRRTNPIVLPSLGQWTSMAGGAIVLLWGGWMVYQSQVSSVEPAYGDAATFIGFVLVVLGAVRFLWQRFRSHILTPTQTSTGDVPAIDMATAWIGLFVVGGLTLFCANAIYNLIFPKRPATAVAATAPETTDSHADAVRSFMRQHDEIEFGFVVEIKPTVNWAEGRRYMASNFTETFVFYFHGNEIVSVWKEDGQQRIRIYNTWELN